MSSYVNVVPVEGNSTSIHVATGLNGTIDNYIALREALATIIILANPAIPQSVIEIAFEEAVKNCQR